MRVTPFFVEFNEKRELQKCVLEGKDEWKYGYEDVVMGELDWSLKKQMIFKMQRVEKASVGLCVQITDQDFDLRWLLT